MGECEPGLICVYNELIADAPGICMIQGGELIEPHSMDSMDANLIEPDNNDDTGCSYG